MALTRNFIVILAGVCMFVFFGLLGTPPVAAADGDAEVPQGQELFLSAKCNMCHSVSTAEIPSKAKSEKLKARDLVDVDPAILADPSLGSFLRKEEGSERDGKLHKKGFKGTDEELQTILDWLGTQTAG